MKALVLEGPPSEHMRGWRHFQIVIKLGHGLKITSALGMDGRGPEFARQLRGKFFARETWETLSPHGSPHCAICYHPYGDCKCQRFPAPRPEILDLLVSENQKEMAL